MKNEGDRFLASETVMASEKKRFRKIWEETGKLISMSDELSARSTEMKSEFSFFMPSEFGNTLRHKAVSRPQ